MIKAGFIFPGSAHTSTTSECFTETAIHQRVTWSGNHQPWMSCLMPKSGLCPVQGKSGKPWGTDRKKEAAGLCGRSEQASISQLSLGKVLLSAGRLRGFKEGCRDGEEAETVCCGISQPGLCSTSSQSFTRWILFPGLPFIFFVFPLELPSSGCCICFVSLLRAPVNKEGSAVGSWEQQLT